jgi:hypothetical protein
MTAPFVEGPLREAMWHLFNSDLAASQAAIAGYRRGAPDDPLACALSAAVRFYHYVSLRIPERDTKSIVGVLLGPGIAMPQGMQKEIGVTLRQAQALAGAPNGNLNSALALCVVESVNRDGLAIVSKRWGPSLAHAEQAQYLARRMIEIDPRAHDAYFVFGSTEYLLSRIPGPVRGLVRVRGASGDRRKAIAFCQAAKLLGGLAEEFSGNPMLRADLMALRARL